MEAKFQCFFEMADTVVHGASACAQPFTEWSNPTTGPELNYDELVLQVATQVIAGIEHPADADVLFFGVEAECQPSQRSPWAPPPPAHKL